MPIHKFTKPIAGGIVLLVIAVVLALSGSYDGEDVPATQNITVIDGDTIAFGNQVYDLAGIDAPELGQRCEEGGNLYPCGETAAFALDKLVGLRNPVCTAIEKGADKGKVVCATRTTNLGANLIEDGLAVASGSETGNYKTLEHAAKSSDLGIWRGAFIVPQKWREGERLQAETDTPFECPVLGLKVDGKLVFAVPTDANHQALSKQTDKLIERFCSVQDARTNGYQHPAEQAGN